MEETDVLAQAIALAQSGRKAEALPLLQRALAADPLNETAWLWLADCLPELDRRVQALEVFVRAVPGARLAQASLAELRQMQIQANSAPAGSSEGPAQAESPAISGGFNEVLAPETGAGAIPSFDGEYGEMDIDALRTEVKSAALPDRRPVPIWIDAARLALFIFTNLLLLLGAALLVYELVLRH